MRINKNGNFVLRGQTRERDQTNGFVKHINVNDGSYSAGFRVVDFQISSEHKSSAGDCQAILALAPDAVVSADDWNWDNQQEIAWASTDSQVTSIERALFSLCDSSVVVVDELYVFVHHAASTDYRVNYYVELEPVDLKAYEYAMNFIQNKSQG